MIRKVRSMVLDGVTYGWRVSHGHVVDESALNQRASGKRACVESLLAFREGTKNAPLRIRFVAGAMGGPEPIERSGQIMIYATREVVRLHLPRTAALLIRRALELGWSKDGPMVIDDGFAFLAELDAASREALFG